MGDCPECGNPAGHNASCSVAIRARNIEVQQLRWALKPFASICLERDVEPTGEDRISGTDLAITPKQVRDARKALASRRKHK